METEVKKKYFKSKKLNGVVEIKNGFVFFGK